MPDISRFFINLAEDLSYLPGRSARTGLLFFAHKVMNSDYDPDHSKYRSGHFLKKIITDDPAYSREIASTEVAFQEFLRLMISHQPKARLVTSDSDSIFIQSKEVPNTRSLLHVPQVCAGTYGTRESLRGLGELNFYLNSVLIDSDQAERNYLVDDTNMIYRIDFGLTRCPEMDSHQLRNSGMFVTKELQENKLYQIERNRALLKFLLLPGALIKSFFTYHRSLELQHAATNLLKTQTFLRLVIRTEDEFVQLLFPGIRDYLSSSAAFFDAINFQKHVLDFKLKGKLTLKSLCPELNSACIMQRYELITKEQNQRKLLSSDLFPQESQSTFSHRA
jgi:hypothetical protein